jgi:hypothetical protein
MFRALLIRHRDANFREDVLWWKNAVAEKKSPFMKKAKAIL